MADARPISRSLPSLSSPARKSIYQYLDSRGFTNIDPIPISLTYYASENQDNPGDTMGGLIGSTFGSHLQINLLWVSEKVRGNGAGAALMATAEDEAIRRGCHISLVDTFSYQAEGFYVKQGYAKYAVLHRAYNAYVDKIFLKKPLPASPSDKEVKGGSIRLSSTVDASLMSVLGAGLDKNTVDHDPSLHYNYNPLRITSSDASDSLEYGVDGHSGASFYSIQHLWVTPDSPNKEELIGRLLDEIIGGAAERSCTAILVYVFDFLSVHETLTAAGFSTFGVLPGWFDGSVTMHCMIKYLTK